MLGGPTFENVIDITFLTSSEHFDNGSSTIHSDDHPHSYQNYIHKATVVNTVWIMDIA